MRAALLLWTALALAAGEDVCLLANPAAELEVEPGIGRITAFRLRGGANVLWRLAPGSPAVASFRGWTNHGGDKVWPAPQEDWPRWQGADWPPDTALDGSRWTVLRREPRRLVIESPESPCYRLRVRRDIALDAACAEAVIRTTYTRTAAHPSRVQAWTISQVPLAAEVAVVPAPGCADLPFRDLAPEWGGDGRFPWQSGADGGRLVAIGVDRRMKLGAAATALAVTCAGTRFIQTSVFDPAASYHHPGVNAIVYAAPGEGYLELEFLGPARVLAAGESLSLSVTWRLEPASGGTADAVLP